jgi:hypothetical protein
LKRLWKDKQAVLLAVFLLFSLLAGGQAGNVIKYQLDGNLPVSDLISDNQSVTINYSISELNIESIISENGNFFRISIPGHIPTSSPGKPELPVLSYLISVPEGADYKVIISGVRSSEIDPSGKKIEGILFPAQEGETKSSELKKPEFAIDKKLYRTKGFIASDTVRIEPLGIVRNNKLANLYISPVRYNPHSNQIEVITSMKIEIIFSNPENSAVKSVSGISSLFDESVGKSILNYNAADVIPGYSTRPVKMVIITDTAFRKLLKPFLKWKTQKGYKLEVLYKGATMAGDTYTKLKDTLTNIYKSSSDINPPPDYLLIIGDVKRIPYYGSGNITDMYYGEFDGNGDYIPDVFIGRLPVADTTELKTVLNKIIQYEKFEFADTNKFYSRALVTAGNDAGYANTMNGQVKYAMTNYIKSSNGLTGTNFYYPQAASSEDSIKKLINKGITFINYTGHGDAAGWLDPTVSIDSMRNKNMYPFVINNACQTAHFSSSSSMGNRMIVSENKGAIGFIGCSNDSYWDEDFYWAVGTGTPSSDPTYATTGLGAYDRLFHTHGESPSDWYFTMGQVNYAGNMAVSASTSSRKRYYWETYNLIGDPSVIPVIGKPVPFNIALADTIPNGIKTLSLNVDPFAYVAISHFDTLWDASYASASGSVVLDLPGLKNDSCMIVITGQNRLPLIKTIHISAITSEYINLTSTSINDIGGNNNSSADFGESFYLKLILKNLGLTSASNLYATISSTSQWITINSDSAYIGTLAAGSEVTISDKLGITVSNKVPDMAAVTIHLMLKDLKSEKHYNIDISLHAPDLQIINCRIDDSVLGDGDSFAESGETFKLIFKILNNGSSDASGQFSVATTNSDLSILEPTIKSGVLKLGETSEIPVTVKLSDQSLSGSSISVTSTLDCSPYILNKDFAFRIGKIRETFEASSFNSFPWINISAVPWTVIGTGSYEGTLCAKSGAISHSATTSLIIRTVFTAADSVKFFYKVSSEVNYDYFVFKLNDAEVFKASGEVPWTGKAVAVPAGANKMEWIYKKDQSVSGGSDCAWIDMIDFSKTGYVNYIQKDLKVARVVNPVQNEKYGQETVTVKVLNIGRDVINSFYLAYKVNNQAVTVKQLFEKQVIPFGDSVTVSFDKKIDLSKYGIYNIATYGTGNNDDYIFNDTIVVKIQNTEIRDSVIVFPNPFAGQFTIYINSKYGDHLHFSLSNITGSKIYEAEKDILAGKNEIIIPDLRLGPAVYYLNIRGTAINKTLTVIKINR